MHIQTVHHQQKITNGTAQIARFHADRQKPYSGKARIVDLKSYTCNPENHESLNQGMVSYEKYLEKQNAKELKTNTLKQ